MAEVARRQAQEEPEAEAGQGDEEETAESEMELLAEAHETAMAKKAAEERDQNLMLAQKC